MTIDFKEIKSRALNDSQELIGKTISKVCQTYMEDLLCIHFTDNTYVTFEATGDDNTREVNIIGTPWEGYTDDWLQLGLITQEQYDKAKEARELINKQSKETREKLEYLRLKSIYEPNND